MGLDARTAHTLRMLATGIAALLAALAALAALAPLSHAAAVTGVTVDHTKPSPAAGARTQYVVAFTTSKAGALSGADASVNVTFPADTAFTGYTGGSVVDVTTRRSIGACNGPSLSTVSCFLFSGETINAGDDVRVSLNGVTNPSKPSEYSLTVSTTTDATPASSPFYVIVAGASLTVSSVANAPSPAVSARTKYVVRLATSKTGGGLSQAANSRITVAFTGADTTFGGYATSEVFDLTTNRAVGSCSIAAATRTADCFLFGGEAIGPADEVRITFEGITNPSKPNTWALSVSSTSDLPLVRAPYDVVARNPLTVTSVQHGDPSAAAGARTQYVVRLTTSKTGGLSQDANSRINVLFPADTTFGGYTSSQVFDVTTNRAVGSCSITAATRTADCFLFSGEAVGAGDDVRLTFSGVTNPTTAGAYALTVSSTSDTVAVGSPTYDVVDGGFLFVTGVIAGDPSGAAGARTEYSTFFTTSKTGGLSQAANSRISIVLPGDTSFGGYASSRVDDETTGRQVGSCSITAGTRTADCFLFNGEVVNGGDDVRVTLSGVTSPTRPGQYTLAASTTSDPNPVPSPMYEIDAANPLTVTQVVHGSPSPAAGARTQYVVRFTTSKAGGLSQAANSRITVEFPGDTTFTGSVGHEVFDVTAGKAVGSCSITAATLTADCFLFSGQAIAPGHDVRLTFSGITNPSKAAAYALDVSTTSDTAPIASPTYDVVGATPLTGVTLTLGSLTPNATTQWVTRFTASGTGGLSQAANSRITIVFATGTGFGGVGSSEVFDLTTNKAVGSCSITIATRTADCFLFNGQLISAGDNVRLTFNGITNPPSGGPWTVIASTTSDTPPVTSSPSTLADSTPPDTTIQPGGPTGPTNNVSPSFSFTSETGATFQCKLDGPGATTGSFAACTSPRSFTNLAPGAYTFFVRATDAAGNTDATPATRSFTVDTAAPQTAIDSGPSGLTNNASPSYGFSSEAGATFQCKLDGPGAATGSFAACTSPRSFSNLALGAYTFSVRATDSAGNTDATPATRSFTVDTAAPQTTIDSGPSGQTNNASPSFGFSSESGATFQCRLDGPGATTGSFAACTSPRSFASLADGAYTFSVRATDPAGNTDGSPATRAFTVDTGEPQTTIDTGPTGTTGDASPNFEFSSDEAGSTFECKLDGPGAATGSFAGCTSPADYANLADGTYAFSVRARDSGGNADGTPATRSFAVDTTPPPAAIDAGPSGSTDDATPTFEFSSGEAGSQFQCKIDSGAFAACTSPFTTLALPPGAHSFEVRAVDAAGNAVVAKRTFTVTAAQTPTPTPTSTPTPPGDADRDLVPDLSDNCPSTANTNQADVDGDRIGDACDRSDATVGPTLARTIVLRVVEGQVLIDTPGGGKAFIPLEGAAIIPLGSIVDTTRGRLALSSIGRGGKPQTAEFYDGIFQIKQKRARRPVTDLILRAPGFNKACATGGSSRASISRRRRSRKAVARLWGSGRGRFRTSGRHSAATVRGTIWLTQERCDGTLTRVRRGVVSVRDFERKRTVLVRAGKKYLARA